MKEKQNSKRTSNDISVIRKVDDRGGIILPIEMRRLLQLSSGKYVDICADQQANLLVLIRHNEKGCVFCGNMSYICFKDKHVCQDCLKNIVKRYERKMYVVQT